MTNGFTARRTRRPFPTYWGPYDSMYIWSAAVERPPDPQLLGFLEVYDQHISDLALALREVILEEAPDASKSRDRPERAAAKAQGRGRREFGSADSRGRERSPICSELIVSLLAAGGCMTGDTITS